MIEESFNPGDIIYADSNFSHAYDCFGVVVDKDFWLEQAKIENVLEEKLAEFDENRHIPFRVLGTKLFRQYWRENNPEEFEPNNLKIMHYRFNFKSYTEKIDLRPMIKIFNTELEHFTGNAQKFFEFKEDYFNEVLYEAKTIYNYLDGKRFDPNVNGTECIVNNERKKSFREWEKLLRLLGKAVPLDK